MCRIHHIGVKTFLRHGMVFCLLILWVHSWTCSEWNNNHKWQNVHFPFILKPLIYFYFINKCLLHLNPIASCSDRPHDWSNKDGFTPQMEELYYSADSKHCQRTPTRDEDCSEYLFFLHNRILYAESSIVKQWNLICVSSSYRNTQVNNPQEDLILLFFYSLILCFGGVIGFTE